MIPIIPARNVLWVDSVGALIVGGATFALLAWLPDFYRLPAPVVVGIAAANVLYGCYSFSLARLTKRRRGLIVALVVANAAWAAACCVGLFVFWNSASIFGLAHLAGEGAFVAYLAMIEWRQREELISGTPR